MGSFFRTIFLSFSGPVFLFIGLLVIFYTFQTVNVDLLPVLSLLLLFAPIWIPVSLFYILFPRWMESIQLKHQDKMGRVTLEITLPQDVFKSPQAMEEVLSQTWNKNKPYNIFQTFWDGKHALTYSFEIVSIGGNVKLFANLPIKKAKDVFEAQMYAQYPGIEIKEVPVDYTAEIKNNRDEWQWMSFHFGKVEDDVFPIKTYIDWGLDKNPKEEEKIEPMAPVLEQMANIRSHERFWLQILAVPHGKKDFSTGSLGKAPDWTSRARAKINEIMGRESSKTDLGEPDAQPRLTMGERDLVTHIERNTSKIAYETVIRMIYAAPKGKFRAETMTSLLSTLKATYTVVGRNDLAVRWRTDFDYNIFSDPSGKRAAKYKTKELDFYKLRTYVPFDVRNGNDAPKVMSVEEIATLWHIPGKAIVTPGVGRVEALRRDAPANLPVGDPNNPWT